MSLAFQCFSGASQDRLEQLIAERLATGADKNAIDARTRDLSGESLAKAFADLPGFLRSIADFGATHPLRVIYESDRIPVQVIDGNCRELRRALRHIVDDGAAWIATPGAILDRVAGSGIALPAR